MAAIDGFDWQDKVDGDLEGQLRTEERSPGSGPSEPPDSVPTPVRRCDSGET